MRAAKARFRDSTIPIAWANPNAAESTARLYAIEWDDATKLLTDKLSAAAKAGKDRVAFIGTSQGPTLDNVTRQWLQAFNSSRAVFWEPFSEEPARSAAQAVFGRRDLPIYKLDQAETIISFGADFTETWGSPVEYARQFAEFRAPKTRKGQLSIGHSAYVGPRMNATAAKCDEWAAANPGTEGAVAMAVLNEILAQGWVANGAGADLESLKAFTADYDPEKVSAANRRQRRHNQADRAMVRSGRWRRCFSRNGRPADAHCGLYPQFHHRQHRPDDGFPRRCARRKATRPDEVQALLDAVNAGAS